MIKVASYQEFAAVMCGCWCGARSALSSTPAFCVPPAQFADVDESGQIAYEPFVHKLLAPAA